MIQSLDRPIVASGTDQSETGMELRDLLSDEEFLHRDSQSNRADRRFEALHELAHVFADAPNVVLQRLVDIAVEFCNADSAGISLEEQPLGGEHRFRWIAISGSFERYLNGTTPRFFSPCGTCMDRGKPQLYRVTQPYYDFLGVQARPITDGILIPWSSGNARGTLWAVAHTSREAFDLDDYRLLNSLADFASIAIRHQIQEEVLRQQVTDRASAARANELAHQINNPLQSLTNALYLGSQNNGQAHIFVEQAAQELKGLSQLVSKLLSVSRTAMPLVRREDLPPPSRPSAS